MLVPLLVFGVLSGWFWIAAAIGWIGSPAVALGTPPDGHRAPRRKAWHQELTRELRRWGSVRRPETGLGPCHADGA
ncbi:hypothetical protein JIX56_00800 [Streptomyces sp. CA-210063]|uniref:hypothetical protein n=1 Tax=Streptomyces sp. CA-210063 TaxID=2801029 RepID=UPI00214AC472|nr:hypothetical protein [Streptomyces sp. CA-210063]UUU28556.1 hypothetical protein JIX56_00800 [Streptomyces sp. CA-210063]